MTMSSVDKQEHQSESLTPSPPVKKKTEQESDKVPETGGPRGPEPTRYGDWERKGRCVDF